MFNQVLAEFAALVGFAALVALVINILKFTKLVTEDNAQKWSAGLNLLGLIALYVFRIFRPEIAVTGVDATLMEVATVGTYIFGYVSQLGISKLTHFIVRGTPVIGKSFTIDEERARARFGGPIATSD